MHLWRVGARHHIYGGTREKPHPEKRADPVQTPNIGFGGFANSTKCYCIIAICQRQKLSSFVDSSFVDESIGNTSWHMVEMKNQVIMLFAVLNVLVTITSLYMYYIMSDKKCRTVTDLLENQRKLPIDAFPHSVINHSTKTLETSKENITHTAPNPNIGITGTTPGIQSNISMSYYPVTMIHRMTYSFNSCTVLIATYKRNKLLEKVLNHLCSMSLNETTRIFSKIIVSWNNINTVVPNKLTSLLCPIPILFKYPKQNVLYNKFIHYPEIETQCKF